MTTEVQTKPKRQTKRRGRGEGSIYLRGDGRWAAEIAVGYGADGKRRRRWVYGATKKDVQDELVKLQALGSAAVSHNAHKETLAQFLDRWLIDVAKPTVRRTTFYNYDAIVKKQINPLIGGTKLQKIEPRQVQGLYSEMERNGVGPNPRRLAHAVLNRAMKYAARQGLVRSNPCDAVEPPKVPKSNIAPLDQRQAAALLAAAKGDRLEALYHVAIGSGMREGELFGLFWSDLDLVAGTVSVRQSLSEVSGKLELGEPKSKAARRRIGLPQHAVKALEEHRKRQMAAGFGGVDFVFCNQSGGPLRRSHFHDESFRPLLTKAGLPPMRFHDLRHTHATLCLLAGENPKVIQERLGHANISITLDTYSHLLPSMTAATAGKLDAIIAAATAENEADNEIACHLPVKAG